MSLFASAIFFGFVISVAPIQINAQTGKKTVKTKTVKTKIDPCKKLLAGKFAIAKEDSDSPKSKSEKSDKTSDEKKSLGFLNGKTENLVVPEYPAVARAVHASGAVNVQVLIDENGNVVSAKAVTGHPLLRKVSEDAALQTKFSPTKLNNCPVKVSGIVVYNFTAQ